VATDISLDLVETTLELSTESGESIVLGRCAIASELVLDGVFAVHMGAADAEESILSERERTKKCQWSECRHVNLTPN